MRIVQIIENLETGGLERMALDLAITQKEKGHQASICCVFEPGRMAAEAQAEGIPVTALHRKPGFSLGTIFQLARHLRQCGAEVAHSHNAGIHIYAAAAARLAGVGAVVNTRHGPASSQNQPYRERNYRAVLPLTGKVVFVSEHSREALQPRLRLRPGKSAVIRNGIRTDRFLARPARPGSALPRIRFGTVGRMVPAKGHAVLLDAFALLLERFPEADLRIVGGGMLYADLETQAKRLGVAGRVRLEELTPDIPAVLETLDVFVFPSLTEGLPLAVLEAMAAGLPIVATRVGGTPEVAPENEVAWYCGPNDASQLAETMYRAATAPDLAGRGQRAMQMARERYGLGAMYEQYDVVYRELMGRN